MIDAVSYLIASFLDFCPIVLNSSFDNITFCIAVFSPIISLGFTRYPLPLTSSRQPGTSVGTLYTVTNTTDYHTIIKNIIICNTTKMKDKLIAILIYVVMFIPVASIGIFFVILTMLIPSKINTFGRIVSICALKCLFVRVTFNGEIPKKVEIKIGIQTPIYSEVISGLEDEQDAIVGDWEKQISDAKKSGSRGSSLKKILWMIRSK